MVAIKKESEKAGLKLNIQKTKIMAPGPITSWQIDWETKETVTDFIFLDSKITADDGCSQRIKRRFLLGRKIMINPIDGSPPGSSILGILQARTLEWVAISFSNA